MWVFLRSAVQKIQFKNLPKLRRREKNILYKKNPNSYMLLGFASLSHNREFKPKLSEKNLWKKLNRPILN